MFSFKVSRRIGIELRNFRKLSYDSGLRPPNVPILVPSSTESSFSLVKISIVLES